LKTKKNNQNSSIPFSWDSGPSEEDVSRIQVASSDLKQPGKFGVFLWWTEQTPSWVHSDDVEIADCLIPSDRVFLRSDCENASDRELGFSKFQYGTRCFRGKPALWLEVPQQEIEIGDRVEVKSQSGKLKPQIACVIDILWNRTKRTVEFRLSANEIPMQRRFLESDLRPAVRLEQHLTIRELRPASNRIMT
jgi:hypothetical protein